MLFEVIIGSIGAAASVTVLLKNILELLTEKDKKETEESIQDVQNRIDELEKQLSSQANDKTLLESYDSFLHILRENRYASHLKFIPTDHGTWKVMCKKKRTILRDPEGEYGNVN